MKKILLSLSLIGILGGITALISANSTSCKEVEFSNGVTACVNIEYAGIDRRRLSTSLDSNGLINNLKCDLMTADSNLRNIGSCNGEFIYSTQKVGRTKLWIRYNNTEPTSREGKPSNSVSRTYPQWVYDFDNGERFDDNSNTNNNTSNDDIDNFYLSTDDTTPSLSQYVDLTVKARDNNNNTVTNYNDTINFTVYYRANNSSTWYATTSSSYYTMNSSYTNGYDFYSSNNGIKTLTNLIKFNKNNYDYKVRVYDENNHNIYNEITFNVGSTNNNNNTSNGDIDNFYLSTNNSSPSILQRTNLNITARDSNNYTITNFSNNVKFKVYYGNADENTWAQTTSSSYYSMNSNYNTNGYDFYSSNNGTVRLTNFIEFNNSNYDYKLKVYDSNNSSIYKEIVFYVNSNNNNTSNDDIDNFYLSTDDTTPSLSQYVDLTVKARDMNNYTVTDYNDTINFTVYYRANNSSTWYATTSSSYYTMNSSYTNGYDFYSSNNGIKTLTNLIKFNKNNYDYKVRVYDENNTSIYNEIIYTVGTTNDNNTSNVNGFTSSQLNTVQSLYNARDNMIIKMKDTYPILKTHTSRKNMSDKLRESMIEIINNDSNKTYDNFTEFYAGFLARYRYTIDVR